ncbi:MAG: PqqD family protein [Candidatus Acidiferrales bacterium]
MLRVTPYVRSTHSQDGGVVLDLRHGQMFHLNFVGSKILELVKGDRGELEIAKEISRDFDISIDMARADVREFLRTLGELHLLEEGVR